MKTSIKIIVFFLIMLCCMVHRLLAQTGNTGTIIPIQKPGTEIPERLWNLPLEVINDPNSLQVRTLKEFKGKLILLDFWGTYCSSCIAAFPKLIKLQREFPDQLKILAVTSTKQAALNKFFHSEVGKAYTDIHSVYNDSILQNYFPHQLIPHIVWISPEGKLVNFTNTEEVTQANIEKILAFGNANLSAKIDLDVERPLFLSDNFHDTKNIMFFSLLSKGHYPGYPSSNYLDQSPSGNIYGRKMTNVYLQDIYSILLDILFEERHASFTLKRMVLETKNDDIISELTAKVRSSQRTFYNYQLTIPVNEADSLYHYMLSDLNRYLDVKVTLQERSTDCYILVRTSKFQKMKSKGGKQVSKVYNQPMVMKNCPVSFLITGLNEMNLTDLPIIDETGYKENIDLQMSGLYSINQVKRELQEYGLDLRKKRERILMAVISDKKKGE